MTILFVSTASIMLKAFLLPLAAHLRNLGWIVCAAASGASRCPECVRGFDSSFDISWNRNPLAPSTLFRSARQIRELVRRRQFDLVHVHTPVAAFVTRWALRRSRSTGRPKIIYTAHGFHFHRGGSFLRNHVFLAIEKLAGRWTDFLVVINQEDQEAARRYGLVPPDRVVFMPGIGVDTALYDPARVSEQEVAEIRSGLGLSPDDRLFLMVAEFNPGKRHRDALNGFALLGNRKTHLAFAGEGRLRKEIEALARTLGIAGRVHFLGLRKDIPALIRASTATLLPSEREGLSRSVMESLCLEVPVIGADARGVRDLLEGGCGLLVPVGDTAALAKAMERVLLSPVEAARMGRNGRQKMAAFDTRHIIELHEQLYARALGERMPRNAQDEVVVGPGRLAKPFPRKEQP